KGAGHLHDGDLQRLRQARSLALHGGRQVLARPEEGDHRYSRGGGALLRGIGGERQGAERLGGVPPGRAAAPLRRAARRKAATRRRARRADEAAFRASVRELLRRARSRRGDDVPGRLSGGGSKPPAGACRGPHADRHEQVAQIEILLRARCSAPGSRRQARCPARLSGVARSVAVSGEPGDAAAEGGAPVGEQAVAVRRGEHIAVFALPALLCAAWTVLAGKDVNWDLLNYHYYLPYERLHERLAQDYFAASGQSYLNSIGFLPFYAMLAAG